MDDVAVTQLELLTAGERWSGVIRSPGGVTAVEISDFAQGDRGAAITEILERFREQSSINEPTNWIETSPGIWATSVVH